MSKPIHVQKSPSNRTHCSKCGYRIDLHSLRVYVHHYLGKAEYFHLRCYSPPVPVPVDFDCELILKGEFSDTETERVKKWVDRWNARFIVSEQKVPIKFLRKRVETTLTASKRPLLSIFQYLTVRETELAAALACKSWFHISREDEYWQFKYCYEFDPDPAPFHTSYRALYIAEVLNRCWACKRFVELSNVGMLCPLHKRPLCTNCIRTPEWSFTGFRSLCKHYVVSAGLADRLKFPTFQYLKARKVYQRDFRTVWVQHAKHRKALLVQCLETGEFSDVQESLLETVRNTDVEQIFKEYHYASPQEVAMLMFIGKDERREEVGTSVKEYLERVSTGKSR